MKKRRALALFASVLSVPLLVACAAAPSPAKPETLRVSGTVAYRERIALDPAAEIVQLLFINDTAYPVLTQGQGQRAELMLVRVTPAPGGRK